MPRFGEQPLPPIEYSGQRLELTILEDPADPSVFGLHATWPSHGCPMDSWCTWYFHRQLPQDPAWLLRAAVAIAQAWQPTAEQPLCSHLAIIIWDRLATPLRARGYFVEAVLP